MLLQQVQRSCKDYVNNNPECMSAPVDYTNCIQSVAASQFYFSINNAVGY